MTSSAKSAAVAGATLPERERPEDPATLPIAGLVQDVFDQLVSRGLRGLAVCGIAEGDGVSHIARSLATALGRAGIATLLVDADLRAHRDRGQDILLDPTLPGLADLLVEPGRDPDETVQFNVRQGLSVLPAGRVTATSADALSVPRFDVLMDRWLREFEFVILDTPPGNQTPDALRSARLAGHAVIVVRRDQTFVGDLNLFIDELRDQGVTILGAVLNEN